MLIMTSILRVGQSAFAAIPIDEDSVERINTCLASLAALRTTVESPVKKIFLHDTQAAYTSMVAHGEQKAAELKAKDSKSTAIQADDLISFRHFAKRLGGDEDEVRALDAVVYAISTCRDLYILMQYELDLTKATGAGDVAKDDFLSKLSRIVQLTGERFRLLRLEYY